MNAITMIEDALMLAHATLDLKPQIIVAPVAIKSAYLKQVISLARNTERSDCDLPIDFAHSGIRLIFSQRAVCVEVF